MISEITVIIPAKGDRKVSKVVNSVLGQKIEKCQILVIRNGKPSYEVEEDFFSIARTPYFSLEQILLNVEGKAKALNYGIKRAKYDIIAIVDADCSLESDAFSFATDWFQDDSVFAVGGKLIVKPHLFNILTATQMIEYSKVFNISRRIFNRLDCNFIISGAFGVFRKDALFSIGGFNEDTVGEDLEIILRMQWLRSVYECHKIIYDSRAVCYTEAPRTLKALLHQRERWQRGFLDAMFKNRKILFSKEYGLLGIVVLPVLCFEALFGPIAIIFGSSGLLNSSIGHYLFLGFLTIQVILSVISELLEPIHSKLIPFIIKAFFINTFSMFLQVLISFARLFGTIFFKRRRMKW